MEFKYTIYIGALVLAACGGDSSAPVARNVPGPGNIFVYADREAVQCESDGISPEASAQTLIDAGIDVLQSTCGARTGVVFPTVCGGGTPDILIHEIRSANQPDAEQLGFHEISALVDEAAGTSYELVACTS